MRQTNREAFNGVDGAIAIGICGVVSFFLYITLLSRPANIKPEEKFVVVDHYKQCDVVRYTNPSNSWNYFLDCRQGG